MSKHGEAVPRTRRLTPQWDGRVYEIIIPPDFLLDPTPDSEDIPPDILASAEESRHAVVD